MTGTCPGCGEQRDLNRRGRFRSHALPSGEQCPGSCRQPEVAPVPIQLGPCPHPEKARYATTAMAARRALGKPAIAGLVLYPYRCTPGCGWVHLSKRRPSEVVA